MSLTDQLGFRFTPLERRVWTVQALVAAVRTHVEREYSDAWVEGEISNFRAPDSGHLYFTLKDGNAQIRVVMFSSKARLLRFRPADGMQVVVRGRVTVYEERGDLQIAISTSGQSPSLAQKIRQQLERQFGPGYAHWVAALGETRRKVLASNLPPERKRDLLQSLASAEAFEALIAAESKTAESKTAESKTNGRRHAI